MSEVDLMKVTGDSLGTSQRVVLLQLRGMGADGDDANAEPIDGAENFSPIGFVSRAKITSAAGSKVYALCIRDGDDVHVLHVFDKSIGILAAADLDNGEAMMFSPSAPADSRIKLDKNGTAKITAGNTTLTMNHSGDVVINGNGPTITMHNNGDTVIAPASGKVISIGDVVANTKFIIGDQETLRTQLEDLRTKHNTLKAKHNTLQAAFDAHTHQYLPGPGAATPTGLPVASGANDGDGDVTAMPAVSTKVKAI